MKKVFGIFITVILFCSVFVYAQGTTTPSVAEVVKDCLAAGNSKDYCYDLCIESGATEEECIRLLPKDEPAPGLISRILNVFRGEPEKEAVCCCKIGDNYYTIAEEACKKRQGRCVKDEMCEQVPPRRLTPDLGRPELELRKCELKKPKPIQPERDVFGCDDCAVTVCFNSFHQEFLCLDGYKRCVEQYLFCRPVFCEPPKVDCGTCPERPPCEEPERCCCMPYKQFMAEDVCRERQGKCADPKECKPVSERVCCQFPAPTTVTAYVPPRSPEMLEKDVCVEEGGTPVSMDICKPAEKDCCCMPYYNVMNEKACKERQGRCADVSMCEDMPEVCCAIGDRFTVINARECNRMQGSKARDADCEDICCQYPTSMAMTHVAQQRPPEVIPRGTCRMRGGTEASDDVCRPTLSTPEPYQPEIDTGDDCRTWRCTPMTATHATAPVTCQGTQSYCEQRYGTCVCAEGTPTMPTITPTRTIQPTRTITRPLTYVK